MSRARSSAIRQRPVWAYDGSRLGLDATGTRNIVPALQSAIDGMAGNRQSEILLPPGRFLCSSGASGNLGLVLRSNIVLRGAGRGQTVLVAADGNNKHLVTATDATDFGVFDLDVDGNRANQTLSVHNFRFQDCERFNVEHVGSFRSAGYGAYLYGGATTGKGIKRVTFRDFYSEESGVDGIDIKNRQNVNTDLHFENIVINGYDVRGVGGKAALDLRGAATVLGLKILGQHPLGGGGVRCRNGSELDAPNIFETQSLGGAGNFTLNGELVSGGVAYLSPADGIGFYSASNNSAATFTITGMVNGSPQVRTVAGPNNGYSYASGVWDSISQISSDMAVTSVYCGSGGGNGVGGRYSTLSNIVAVNEGATAKRGMAVTINCPDVTVTGVTASNLARGLNLGSASQNVETTGFVARGCTEGAQVLGSGNGLGDFGAYGCDTGVTIGGTDNRLADGTLNNTIDLAADTITSPVRARVRGVLALGTTKLTGYTAGGFLFGPGNAGLPNESELSNETAGRNLSYSDSGKTFTNTGATSRVDLVLPNAYPRLVVRGIVTDADGIRFARSSPDTILFGGSSVNSVTSTTRGSTIELTCVDAGEWIAATTGTWT